MRCSFTLVFIRLLPSIFAEVEVTIHLMDGTSLQKVIPSNTGLEELHTILQSEHPGIDVKALSFGEHDSWHT